MMCRCLLPQTASHFRLLTICKDQSISVLSDGLVVKRVQRQAIRALVDKSQTINPRRSEVGLQNSYDSCDRVLIVLDSFL